MEPGGSELERIRELLGRTITAVENGRLGRLELTFDDKTVLSAAADPDAVSWHLTGTGVDAVTVGPGGETDWQAP